MTNTINKIKKIHEVSTSDIWPSHLILRYYQIPNNNIRNIHTTILISIISQHPET